MVVAVAGGTKSNSKTEDSKQDMIPRLHTHTLSFSFFKHKTKMREPYRKFFL